MKAKETIYKGYHFRSRTEARWAVFFDAMGIEYLYEHEDFVLPAGRYLPDFYLPGYENGKGAYCEVKGVFTADEKAKCRQLCEKTGCNVILLEGVPDYRAYDYYTQYSSVDENSCPHKCSEGVPFDDLVVCKHDPCPAPSELSIELADGIISSDATKYGNRMYVFPGFKTFEPEDWYDGYKYAINAARSARFEFGQSGATAYKPVQHISEPLIEYIEEKKLIPSENIARELDTLRESVLLTHQSIPAEPLTQEALNKAWGELRTEYEAKGFHMLKFCFKDVYVEVTHPNRFAILAENRVAYNCFKPYIAELTEKLKPVLNNDLLTIGMPEVNL